MITRDEIDSLPGAHVIDSDGDTVGDVNQVYVSDDGSEPLFITVKTGLFGTKETFVPLEGATFSDDGLRVLYDKSVIKDAPRIDADQHLSDDEQGSLFDYYDQRAGGAAAGRSGAADTTTTGTAGYDTTDTGSDTTTTGYDATTADAQAGSRLGSDDAAYTTGRDTSGANTDDAMTLSEERLNVGVQQVETGRARLRKHIVTEQRTVTVPVTHEEVRIEREPITDANRGAATDGPELSEEEHEVILTEERPVVTTETVPVERVRLTKDAVSEQQDVTQEVRHEEVDTDGVDTDRTTGVDADRTYTDRDSDSTAR